MPKNFLKQIREDKGIDGATFAEKIGTSFAHLSRFENNKGNFSTKLIRRVTAELNVSREYLFTGEEDHKIPKDQKEIMMQAARMTLMYYKDKNYDDDFGTKIATELYELILDYQNKSLEKSEKLDLIEQLETKYLSIKCFVDYLKNNEK